MELFFSFSKGIPISSPAYLTNNYVSPGGNLETAGWIYFILDRSRYVYHVLSFQKHPDFWHYPPSPGNRLQPVLFGIAARIPSGGQAICGMYFLRMTKREMGSALLCCRAGIHSPFQENSVKTMLSLLSLNAGRKYKRASSSPHRFVLHGQSSHLASTSCCFFYGSGSLRYRNEHPFHKLHILP